MLKMYPVYLLETTQLWACCVGRNWVLKTNQIKNIQFQTPTISKPQPNPNLNQIQTPTKSKPQPNPILNQIQTSTKSKPQTNTNLNQIQTSTKPNKNKPIFIVVWGNQTKLN